MERIRSAKNLRLNQQRDVPNAYPQQTQNLLEPEQNDEDIMTEQNQCNPNQVLEMNVNHNQILQALSPESERSFQYQLPINRNRKTSQLTPDTQSTKAQPVQPKEIIASNKNRRKLRPISIVETNSRKKEPLEQRIEQLDARYEDSNILRQDVESNASEDALLFNRQLNDRVTEVMKTRNHIQNVIQSQQTRCLVRSQQQLASSELINYQIEQHNQHFAVDLIQFNNARAQGANQQQQRNKNQFQIGQSNFQQKMQSLLQNQKQWKPRTKTVSPQYTNQQMNDAQRDQLLDNFPGSVINYQEISNEEINKNSTQAGRPPIAPGTTTNQNSKFQKPPKRVYIIDDEEAKKKLEQKLNRQKKDNKLFNNPIQPPSENPLAKNYNYFQNIFVKENQKQIRKDLSLSAKVFLTKKKQTQSPRAMLHSSSCQDLHKGQLLQKSDLLDLQAKNLKYDVQAGKTVIKLSRALNQRAKKISPAQTSQIKLPDTLNERIEKKQGLITVKLKKSHVNKNDPLMINKPIIDIKFSGQKTNSPHQIQRSLKPQKDQNLESSFGGRGPVQNIMNVTILPQINQEVQAKQKLKVRQDRLKEKQENLNEFPNQRVEILVQEKQALNEQDQISKPLKQRKSKSKQVKSSSQSSKSSEVQKDKFNRSTPLLKSPYKINDKTKLDKPIKEKSQKTLAVMKQETLKNESSSNQSMSSYRSQSKNSNLSADSFEKQYGIKKDKSIVKKSPELNMKQVQSLPAQAFNLTSSLYKNRKSQKQESQKFDEQKDQDNQLHSSTEKRGSGQEANLSSSNPTSSRAGGDSARKRRGSFQKMGTHSDMKDVQQTQKIESNFASLNPVNEDTGAFDQLSIASRMTRDRKNPNNKHSKRLMNQFKTVDKVSLEIKAESDKKKNQWNMLWGFVSDELVVDKTNNLDLKSAANLDPIGEESHRESARSQQNAPEISVAIDKESYRSVSDTNSARATKRSEGKAKPIVKLTKTQMRIQERKAMKGHFRDWFKEGKNPEDMILENLALRRQEEEILDAYGSDVAQDLQETIKRVASQRSLGSQAKQNDRMAQEVEDKVKNVIAKSIIKPQVEKTQQEPSSPMLKGTRRMSLLEQLKSKSKIPPHLTSIQEQQKQDVKQRNGMPKINVNYVDN